MEATRRRRERPPLDGKSLGELALAYVGRFATTRGKLGQYLTRKVRERGWAGEDEADIAGVVERLAASGYVDDAAYALSKARTLTERGYGGRRVWQSLTAAGVGEEDRAPAAALAEDGAVAAALKFARRRHLGPFAATAPDRAGRERAIAAMLRAGHGFAIARLIVELAPGAEVDPDRLAEAIGTAPN
ncbi:RecX family transcriptional regulator [Sphingomonas sp.]|uniref:regulatory protein RecX n=1 Tax=Sphingomonas sp. TaxID=28214 RepID=UPI00286DB189|nr:RecX family transcriptional regulator [Sphingomonas sp.]